MADIAATAGSPGSQAEARPQSAPGLAAASAVRYGVPLVLGAFLLFQVQPIVARRILPWFGGTPSVWTTCMLFFQVLLVGDYAYAHLLSTRTRPRAQALVHWVVMAASLAAVGWMTLAWGTPLTPNASSSTTDKNSFASTVKTARRSGKASRGLPRFRSTPTQAPAY